MANKLQGLLTDAFKKLISVVYKGGSADPKFLKVDELGLATTEIDFVRVLGSSEAKAIVDEFAEKVSQVGFDEADVDKITDDFVKSIADVVKLTNADLSQEVHFETKFKQMFAGMILQKAQSMNQSRDSESGVGSPQRGGNNMQDISTQLLKDGDGSTFNQYQFQIMMNNANVKYSPDTIISMLVTALLENSINIDEIINIMQSKSIEFKFSQIIDGEIVNITIDDAVERIRAHLKVMIQSRTDILKVLVDKVTKDIKVDVEVDLAKQITDISAILSIDAEVFKALIVERLSDINFSYKFKGTKLVRTKIAELVNMDDAVKLTLEKLGVTDGTITTKLDVTKGVVEAIREVSVSCGVSISTLIAELKSKTKIKLVDENNKELTDEDLENAVLSVVQTAQDTATLEVVEKISTLIPVFKDMKLSEKEIVDKIGAIAFSAQVNIDEVVNILLSRTDISVSYVDIDGKTVNMETILKSKIKSGLIEKAENGVISSINTVLKNAKFDGELNEKSLANIVENLQDIAATYSINVEDLVNLIVENKAIAVTEYKLDGKVVGVDKVKETLLKALHKEALKDAQSEIQGVLDKLPTDREVDIVDLVLSLKPIEMKYGIDIDTIVEHIAAENVSQTHTFYYMENGKKVVVNQADLDEAILGRLDKYIQAKSESGLVTILSSILSNVTTNGKITDFSAVLGQIAEVAVNMSIDVDTLVDALKTKFNVVLDDSQLLDLTTKLNGHIEEDAITQLANTINSTLAKGGRTLDSKAVIDRIMNVSITYGFNPQEILDKLVESGKLTITLNAENVKTLKEGIEKYAGDTVLDKLLAEFGVDDQGNIVLPDGTLDSDRVANKITSISQAFGMDPEAIIAKLLEKDAFKASVDPNKLKVLTDKIKGNAKARGYAKLLEALGVNAQGNIDLGKVDLDPDVVAKKITSISATFGVDADALLELLHKDGKLSGVIDFDKDDFFKKVSDKVKGAAIDKFADDMNNATKGGIKGTLSPEDLKAIATKLNPIVIKYNFTDDQLNQLISLLQDMGKISGEIDPKDQEKLQEALAKVGIKDKISFTDIVSIMKVAGIISNENQSMFNIVTNVFAGDGHYNPGAGICRPAAPNIIVVGGGANYMPMGMMPGMFGGFGGGFIGGFGGGMVMPPYMQLPPYWPGFTPPDGNNDKLLKALQDMADSITKLTKRVEDLEKGGTGTGGTGTTPPTKKEYIPTEDEILDILQKMGIAPEKFVSMDDVAVDGLVDPITKALEAMHPDHTIKGVKRTLQSLKTKLIKTNPTPAKDDKYMVTKDDIAKLMYAVGFVITDKKDLKKVPGIVASKRKELEAICGSSKLEGVDQAVADYIAWATNELSKMNNKPQPQPDEVVLPDTSKPVEGKKSAWRRFWSWANRHKVMLLGIGLTVGAGALGLGFAANAINGLIMSNIASGSAAAASGILMEGGFVHGLVSRLAETGFATWINGHAPIAGLLAGGAGLGGIVATTLGAVNITKGRRLASSYNGVLKSRKKVMAANGKTRNLIKQKLHLTEMLYAKQQEREELKYSSKERSRITKEIKEIKKEIERVDGKLAKAEKKETGKQIKELRKVEKLNSRESKFGRKVSGSKGVGTKGFTQKYIDLVQKFRAGQIDEDTFREKVEAIPQQYRRLDYDTFNTEVKEDLAKYRANTEAGAQVKKMTRTGKTVEEIEDEFNLN